MQHALARANRELAEHRRAEDQLRASEQQYRTLFENLPIPVFAKDLAGRYTSCNSENLKYWSTNPLGHTDDELLPPATARALRDADRQVIERQTALDLEEQIPTPTGWRTIISRKVPLRDHAGKIVGILGVSLDITERKQLERELQKQRDFAIQVINTMGQGLSITNGEDRFEFVNPAYSGFMGYTPEELIGKRPRDITVPIDQATLERALHDRQQGKTTSYESRLIHKDGHIVPVLITGTPRATTGAYAGSIAVITDLTKLKQLEHELQTERDFAFQVLNLMGQGLTVTDEEGRFILVNSAYARMVGYMPSDLIGKKPQDVTIPEDHTILAQARAERQAGKTTTYETRFRRHDGTLVHALITGVPRWRDNRVVGTVAVITDLTERKQMEEQLRTSEELYRQMFTNHSAMMLLLAPETGAIVDANIAAANFYGYSREDLGRMNINQLSTLPSDIVHRMHQETLHHGKSYFVLPHRLATGEIRDVEVYSVLIHTAQRTVVYSIIHDISARLSAETQLRYLSTHDTLTGLYNRAFFESEITRLEQRRQFPLSIIIADVDNMKVTNDTLGHMAGDELLKRVAVILREVLRASDIIARIGGDEFAILLPTTDTITAQHVLERVKSKLAQANRAHAGPPLQLSLGVATAEDNVMAAFKLADARMYADKRRHKETE